jgi:peptidoglycan/LPS O-acetylase OafA/YrhL
MATDALPLNAENALGNLPAKQRLSSASRFVALDGLRGIAVLLVMIFHYCEPLYHKQTIFSKIVFKLTHFGWCGVDLFFVLSGFLITGILLDAKGSDRYFSTFYIRRTLRIFPLYYGILAICFLVVPLFGNYKSIEDNAVVSHQQALWCYYTNIDIVRHGWVENGDYLNMSHFWSLAVEEQFYIVWPFIVWVCSRRMLIGTCVICICGALLFRTWYAYGLGNTAAASLLMQCRIDALAWGALAAMFVRGARGATSIERPAKCMLFISAFVLISICVKFRCFPAGEPLVLTIGLSALAIFFTALVIVAVLSTSQSWFGRVCRNDALRSTGRIAYGLYVFHYLIHPFLLPILTFSGFHVPYVLAAIMYLLSAFAAAFTISWLSWHMYEKHFLRLKDRLAPTLMGKKFARKQ